MAKTTPITDQQRARVLELHAAGTGRNDIARDVGIAAATVTKIVHESGGSFDRTATEAATRARQADLKALRVDILRREYNDWVRQLEIVEHPQQYQAKMRGAGAAEYVKILDFIPADDRRQLNGARAHSERITANLENRESASGVDAVKSMLAALGQSLRVIASE